MIAFWTQKDAISVQIGECAKIGTQNTTHVKLQKSVIKRKFCELIQKDKKGHSNAVR